MGFTWSSIKYLGIDRANAYRQAALKHLPDVKICFDVFHLVSNRNDAVDKVRRAEFAHPTEAQRKRLIGRRYLLLKAQAEPPDQHGRALGYQTGRAIGARDCGTIQ